MPKGTLKIKVAAAAVPVLVGALALAIGATASGGTSHGCSAPLPRGADPVHLDPADFSANVDNPQWPMTVGSRWVYRVLDYSDGSVKRDVIKVTKHTKLIADGIKARVVSDVVRDHGKPTEKTRDWYAQDK